MANKNDYEVKLSYEEAKKICERLESDASWDKACSGYYKLKRQLAAIDFIVDGENNN